MTAPTSLDIAIAIVSEAHGRFLDAHGKRDDSAAVSEGFTRAINALREAQADAAVSAERSVTEADHG